MRSTSSFKIIPQPACLGILTFLILIVVPVLPPSADSAVVRLLHVCRAFVVPFWPQLVIWVCVCLALVVRLFPNHF